MGAIFWCAALIWISLSPPLDTRRKGGSCPCLISAGLCGTQQLCGSRICRDIVPCASPELFQAPELWQREGMEFPWWSAWSVPCISLCLERHKTSRLPLAFMLNSSAGEHQSCECTPAPLEGAPAPSASVQGSTWFPQAHLHGINSRENCPCTYPLHGLRGFLSELWAGARYRCHLSVVVQLLPCSDRGCVGWVLPCGPGGSHCRSTALHGWIWAPATSPTAASIQQDGAPKILSASVSPLGSLQGRIANICLVAPCLISPPP